jgi:hypothetical protein
MNGDNLLRRIFEHVGRPERPVDAGAYLLKLGGHAAIEDVDAT